MKMRGFRKLAVSAILLMCCTAAMADGFSVSTNLVGYAWLGTLNAEGSYAFDRKWSVTAGVEYNPYMTIRNDSIPFIDDIRLTDSLSELLSPERYYCPEDEVAANLDETKLLDLSVESKKLEKRMALGEALPQLGVGALYGYNNFMNKGSMNGAVFAVLQIPISDWGKTSRKMQRIDYQLQKSENEREYLQTQLVLQVHKLWMDLTAAWEKLQVAEETAATAEAVERQMYDHYLAGMVTISELLQTQTQLTDARNQVLDGKIAYQTALTAYLDKTGNKR